MHILLIGATGYVGREFVRRINFRGHQLSTLSRRDCPLMDVDAVVRQLESASLDVMINCAGYTGKPNVDACEFDKANCLAGNAFLPGVLSEACQRLGLSWGHVSSGCIFTGRRADGGGFTERDAPNFSFRQNNCSFYSGTKALGEEILQSDPSCYIWRMRMPFSNIDSSRNYLSKVMNYDRLLEAENSLSNLPEFVDACLDCVERSLPFGIYNLTNPGTVTTSQVVQWVQEAGLAHKKFEFFRSELEFMRQVAKTPRSNCVLDCNKALEAGLNLRPVEVVVRESLSQWVFQASRLSK